MAEYAKIEEKRKKLHVEYRKKQMFGLAGGAGAVLGFLLFMVAGGSDADVLFIVLIAVSVVIALIFFSQANKINNQFRTHIKRELVDDILKKHFEVFQYYQQESISEPKIRSAGLEKRPDRFKGEDLIIGKYKGIEFKVSDIQLIEKQVRSNGKTTTVTYVPYFTGRWYVYKFPKVFKETLKIVENRYGVNTKGLDKYESEMVEFNKKFTIYSSSQQFFFYMINAYMIERLLLLENAHKGSIKYAIINDELHIGINDNSNSLELSINKPINKKAVEIFEEDIKLIKDIVDELYLDDEKYR